jgi:phospholipid/cholesterol/gamma-HCH transport system substrate-binding protein
VVKRVGLSALSAATIAVAAIVLLGGGASHRIRAVFTAAIQLRPGNEVRIAGRTIGDVQSVALDNDAALVTLGIDNNAWPLHAGTTAQLRFGSAAAYASRYIQLQPGPARNSVLPEDALLPEADTRSPVEFDQIYQTFDAATRRNLAGTIAGAARTLTGHGADVARDLEQGAPGVQETANMLGDLAIDPAALGTLITAGASTTAALRATDPQLQGLVTNAAQTFSVFADNATALQASIERLPETLGAAQRTLAHLDRSLTPLGVLLDDLAPGAPGLVSTAPLLTRALATLQRIAPLAGWTLRIGTQRLPAVSRLLDAARPFLPALSRVLDGLAPVVGCIRPYAPEIGGYLATWQEGPIDTAGHYGRVNLIQTPITPGTTLTSTQAVAQSHGALRYAFPRPPGLNAGQVWYQPQCGAGPDALNPADDPEGAK